MQHWGCLLSNILHLRWLLFLARILQKIILNHEIGIRCVGIDINTIQMERAIQSITEHCSYEKQCNIQIRNESLLEQSPTTATPSFNNNRSENEHDIMMNSSTPYIQEDEIDYSVRIGSNCSHLSLFEDATVVYLFLLPKALIQVKHILDNVIKYRREKVKNTTRNSNITTSNTSLLSTKFQVVSYMFQIHGWTPILCNRTTKAGVAIYLYDHAIIET
jgi:hypothetical protein